MLRGYNLPNADIVKTLKVRPDQKQKIFFDIFSYDSSKIAIFPVVDLEKWCILANLGWHATNIVFGKDKDRKIKKVSWGRISTHPCTATCQLISLLLEQEHVTRVSSLVSLEHPRLDLNPLQLLEILTELRTQSPALRGGEAIQPLGGLVPMIRDSNRISEPNLIQLNFGSR